MSRCRACSGRDLDLLIDLGPQPVAHRMRTEPDGPDSLVHPLKAHFCRDCGLIQILEPIDPDLLYLDYNYCFSSWKKQPHITDEIGLMLEAGAVGPLLEVGSNDGLFMHEARGAGISPILGVEPNPFAVSFSREKGLDVHQSMFDRDFPAKIKPEAGKFKTIAARQVLEHILDLDLFFANVDALLAPDGFLFLEVPDFRNALRRADVSGLWEEHVNYFTPASLTGLLRTKGFEPVLERGYDFSGGALALLCRRAKPSPRTGPDQADLDQARSFAARAGSYQSNLKNVLGLARSKGFRTVLYGVGCRGCVAVNGLGLSDMIDFAIDDQPERQSMFVPGCGLAVRSLERGLAGQGPVLFLLAVNNENEDAVQSKIMDTAGPDRRTEWLTLFSPKDIARELVDLQGRLAGGR